jgi:hypothetical protein
MKILKIIWNIIVVIYILSLFSKFFFYGFESLSIIQKFFIVFLTTAFIWLIFLAFKDNNDHKKGMKKYFKNYYIEEKKEVKKDESSSVLLESSSNESKKNLNNIDKK